MLDIKTDSSCTYVKSKFNELVKWYNKSKADLWNKYTNNSTPSDIIEEKKYYRGINFEEKTNELRDEYKQCIAYRSLDEQQQIAGHFLFEVKKDLFGCGWEAARDFTNCIITSSPLKDKDKINYIKYCLELVNPQKEENKIKKPKELHPLDISALKKLAKVQPENKEQIKDIFNHVDTYLNNHKKYAPIMNVMLESFANNLQKADSELVVDFARVYIKSFVKSQNVKCERVKNLQNLQNICPCLNKIMAREGNSKEMINGVVEAYADCVKKYGVQDDLHRYMTAMIEAKIEDYDEKEYLNLRDNCLKRNSAGDLRCFLDKIKPQNVSEDKEQDGQIYKTVEPNFSTIKINVFYDAMNCKIPVASDYYNPEDYADKVNDYNNQIFDIKANILHSINSADNPKEKVLQVAEDYNKAAAYNMNARILNNVAGEVFADVVKNPNYKYSQKDIKDLLEHISKDAGEVSTPVEKAIKTASDEVQKEAQCKKIRIGAQLKLF